MPHSRNAPPGARLRRAVPLLVLGLALCVTGVGAFQAQRASSSHRDTAEALLRDYGVFASWSYSRHAADFLNDGIRSSLYPLRRELLHDADPRCLEAVLEAARHHADCGCGIPLGGRFAFHALLAPRPGALAFAGDAPGEAVAAALLDAVTRDLAGWESPRPYGVVQLRDDDGAPMLVAYVRLRGDAGGAGDTGNAGDEAVYGIEVDRARFAEEMTRALEHPELLPRSLTRGEPNASLVTVRVLGSDGAVLFAADDEPMPAIHADHSLPEQLSGATVRAAVLPEAADGLIIGGVPGDRTPWMLLLFGAAAGLMILSVSLLRKESELARLRSDFVASVSHELRTPLAQIRLFVETIRLGRARSEAERAWAFDRIERETRRLGGLVDRILHFHRAERGAVPRDRVLLDLRDEVADAASSFEVLIRPGQARLRLDLDRAPLASVHPDSFRQIVLNLLENAVKYGPHGQTVRVTAELRDGIARLVVEDEGPGVPAAERQVIWEPFRRGGAAVGTVNAGGGIGLAVVREIAGAHGGRAWVEDAPGGGARFVVELPGAVARDPRPDPGQARATAAGAAAGATAGSAAGAA